MNIRHCRALLGAACLLVLAVSAHAQSTINTGQPSSESNLTSEVVRAQFTAAASDINGLLSKHPATSVGQCPATPYVGEDCLTIGSTPYNWLIWTGGTGGWASFATINISTGVVTIPLNAGNIAALNPLAVTFPAGLATLALNFNASLVKDGSNNLGLNLANPNTFTATQTFPAGSLTNTELANSTISGISLGSNLDTLTFGTHLAAGGTSYNGGAGVTISTDATSLNTASAIVARDSSGNFAAGTITASLTGHASLDLALGGGTMSGNLAMGSNAISGVSTLNGDTVPASAILGLTDTQAPTNKSFTSATDVIGGVTMTLGSDATGDLYCRNSSGLLSRIGIGAASTLLTSGGAGTCPAWVAAPGGGNVSNKGTPTANQFALWTSATVIEGVNAAAKTDQQTGTSAILPVTPSQQQQHDSATKSWISFTSSTGATLAAYNASASRTSAGLYVITFGTPFATANYACTVDNVSNAVLLFAQINSKTASTVTVQTATSGGTPTDGVAVDVQCHGRQ